MKQLNPPKGLKWVIHTASGQVPLRVYVDGWRLAKSAPETTEFETSLQTWFPVSRAELLDQFSKAVHDRINAHVPHYRVGRKWRDEYQLESMRAARDLNNPRLRVHWLPHWLKPRFAHRLATFND